MSKVTWTDNTVSKTELPDPVDHRPEIAGRVDQVSVSQACKCRLYLPQIPTDKNALRIVFAEDVRKIPS